MNTNLTPCRYYHFIFKKDSLDDATRISQIVSTFSSFHLFCHDDHFHVILNLPYCISKLDLTFEFPFLDVPNIHAVRDLKYLLNYLYGQPYIR